PAKETLPFPDPEEHNQKLEIALGQLQSSRPSYAIIDKGRHENEKSCIWVEQGHFYAMGYIDNEMNLSSPEDIKDCLERYPENYYMMQMITSFARKYPGKILHLPASDLKTEISY